MPEFVETARQETAYLPVDVAASVLEAAIEVMPNIDDVDVTRTPATGAAGYNGYGALAWRPHVCMHVCMCVQCVRVWLQPCSVNCFRQGTGCA